MSDARRKRYPGALRTRNENGEESHRPQSGSQTYHPRGRNNNSQSGQYRDGPQRINSSEKVKKIIQTEGRTARNLVIYNVPIQPETGSGGGLQTDRSRSRQVRKPLSKEQKEPEPRVHTKSVSELTKSPKSDGGKKPDLRARYWKFLFDNLQRAVDAIYETCEQDESALECKEVMMMLEQSTRDFQSLIDRMQVQKAFENAKDGNRPSSIAWEVRKMSPGKSPSGLGHHGHTSPSPAQRVLNFSYGTDQIAVKQSPASGNSWADRVKGIPPSPCGSEPTKEEIPEQQEQHPVLPSPPVLSPVQSSFNESGDSFMELNESEESDGWETVQRGWKGKQKSPAQRSLENLHTAPRPEPKLTRSVSDPHTCIEKYKKHTNSRGKGPLPQRQPKAKAVKNEFQSNRPRTDSKDSEKENIPNRGAIQTEVVTASVTSANTNGPIENKSPSDSIEVVKDSQQSKTNTVDRQNKAGSARKGNVKPTGSDKTQTKPGDKSVIAPVTNKPKVEERSQHKPKGPSSGVRHSAWAKPLKVVDKEPEPQKTEEKRVTEMKTDRIVTDVHEVKTDSVVNDVIHDSEIVDTCMTEEQAEDQLVNEIDNALASAMDEEDTLTNELEKEQDQALESAIQEEETWLKELAREENLVIEVETENEESDLGNTTSSLDTSQPAVLDWDSMIAEYDARESSGEVKSWSEMAEEEAEARTPGHAVHMHEKLSSPSRKRSPTESKKRHEEKQAKAQELRDKLMQEKSERLREIGKKVEEVRAYKEELMRQKKLMIEQKMQQAEEKRLTMLKSKALKAHDEEAKANEIAFINSLEAQNKRLDIMTKYQESEARLQDIQDERQRRHEEKLAKEAAVEERRKTLHAERLARLQEIKERRKIKDARIEQQKEEKENERQEALRAKEKEREGRLAALNAQHELHIQELQKKIQQKQDESTQRYQEGLKHIREKAFEMSVLRHSTEDHNDAPEITPYDKKKMCTICNALISSEVYLLSHLRGKAHQEALKRNNNGIVMSKHEIENFNLKHIINAPDNSTHPKIVSEKERQKSLKKRCKKLKQRMNTRGLEYDTSLSGKQTPFDSEHRAKLQKVIRDINKYLQSQDSGPWTPSRVSALDRALGEISRVFDKKLMADQSSFRLLGGLTSLSRVTQLVDLSNPQAAPVIPQKTLVLVCTVFKQACKGHFDNCHYMMFSNKISLLIELLIHQLTLLLPAEQLRPSSAGSASESTSSPPDPKLPYNVLALHLMQLLSTILSCLAKNSPATKSSEASIERMGNTVDTFTSRGNDIISYIISVGIVDKLTQYLRMVQGPIDNDKEAAEFLQGSLGLLVAITKFMSKRKTSLFDKKKIEDPTQLISTFEVTELVGIVSLLYGMLFHSGTPSRGDTAPPEFPQHTLSVATTGLRMLNHMATLDLDMMQTTLGQEGTSLEFRHIASYLIWYCSHHNAEELLHEVIICVGYFTVKYLDNQVVIQSGQPPTVLQQLCSLPFQYFSDPRLVNVLFPTLISCCYNNQANREILEQELSCVLLSNFIEEKQLEAQQQKLTAPTTKKGAEKEKRENKEGESRMILGARFPVEQWTAAQEYFKIT